MEKLNSQPGEKDRKAILEVTELLQKIVDTPNELYLSDWELGYEDGKRGLARELLRKIGV